MSTDVKLTNVRLSFPVLWTPEAFPGTTKKRFSATYLIEPGSQNDKLIQAAILAEATAAWPKTFAAMLESFRGNANKYCYVRGDLKEYEGYAGMLALSGHRYEESGRPLIIDQAKNPLTPSDGKPYAGCYVNATVQIYAQVKQYPGIRCGLLGIQFAKDGDAFSGGKTESPDSFDSLEVGAGASAAVSGASSLV